MRRVRMLLDPVDAVYISSREINMDGDLENGLIVTQDTVASNWKTRLRSIKTCLVTHKCYRPKALAKIIPVLCVILLVCICLSTVLNVNNCIASDAAKAASEIDSWKQLNDCQFNAINQTDPLNNQTNPFNNQTNPFNNQTNPLNDRQTNPINNQTNPLNDRQTNPINNQTDHNDNHDPLISNQPRLYNLTYLDDNNSPISILVQYVNNTYLRSQKKHLLTYNKDLVTYHMCFVKNQTNQHNQTNQDDQNNPVIMADILHHDNRLGCDHYYKIDIQPIQTDQDTREVQPETDQNPYKFQEVDFNNCYFHAQNTGIILIYILQEIMIIINFVMPSLIITYITVLFVCTASLYAINRIYPIDLTKIRVYLQQYRIIIWFGICGLLMVLLMNVLFSDEWAGFTCYAISNIQ